MLKEDLIWQSNMTNNLNLMQSSTIRITKDLGARGCAENLGIGYSTLTKWLKDFRESGDIPVRGSGNYASDEQKEIARLRRELRDAQDALDVLKKQSTFWGKMIGKPFILKFLHPYMVHILFLVLLNNLKIPCLQQCKILNTRNFYMFLRPELMSLK